MKLSAQSNLCPEKTLEKTLSVMRELGIKTVCLGAGGNLGKDLCDPVRLLKDKTAFYKFRETFNTYDIDICALSADGNPLHPEKELGSLYDADIRNAILLCEQLEIDTVILSAGCPGDHEGAKHPNFIAYTPCPELKEVLAWQWNEVIIPYFKDIAEFAQGHGIKRIAVSMRAGTAVYDPKTLLKLREAIGDIIGADLDPAELLLLGIDPVLAVRELGDSIYHVSANDVRLDTYNIKKNGMLCTSESAAERPWMPRTVGCGNGEMYWKDIVSALGSAGYDGVFSVGHTDAVMSAEDSLRRAVAFIKPIL